MPSFLPPTTLRRRVFLSITILVLLTAVSLPLYFSRRVQAAGFTAGNIVVYRVGDGSAALSNAATAVFLDEYTPAGVLVQSIPMPTALVGSNRRLTASGTATSEGFLTLTSNGQYLVVPGYDAALGTAGVNTSASATVNRVVGRVDSAGAIDTTTAISDAFSGGNPRGATGDGGTNFWVVGSVSGVRLVTLGSSGSSTSISTTNNNLRATNIFAGQLYASSGAGTGLPRLGTVGSGTPTTSGQTITQLPGISATATITGFFFADLDAGVAGVDTLYVADDSANQLQKYSLVGGTWTANGSIAATAARGLTGSVSGSTVTLFGTLGAAGNTLYRVVDSSGYNGTLSGTTTTIASAGTNKAFRGVALAPASGPPNQAIVPSCPASLSTTQGTPTSVGVSATDPDGTVTSATITSAPVTGITLTGVTPAGAPGGTLTATLSVANNTPAGTYNVTIQYSNNDSPTPQTATCTVIVTVTPPNQPIAPSCPGSLNVNQGSSGSTGVSATDPDGIVTSASITSAPVAGITLDSFTPAGASGGTASATLNIANSTALGTYNVDIQWTNNDSPTPQTATCTVIVTVQPAPGSVVISQVYGGGGNSGSTLKNDFIELINHSGSPVSLNGWSVQAFVSTTNTWQVTPLTNVTLQPGQYYLIQEAAQGGGTQDLPTPDASGTIPVSSQSTKVALVSNTNTITATCPSAGVIDLVGYGGTNCFEGSGTAPTLSNTTAALRRNEGCFDTDDNAADFISGSPNPHNTSSPVHDCTSLSGFGSANPSTVLQGDSTTLTVHVAFAQNPTSTGVTVRADLSSIGGSPTQAFAGAGNTFTFNATVPSNNPPGMKSFPVTITDAEARTANTSILLSVLPIVPDHITISQLYGGGGNSGAPYQTDYVELYNPTAATVNITGWSIQYASAAGTSWTNKQPIGGIIGPGEYYLVSLASGNNGSPLPVTPNISGTINMSATTGKLALVKNSANLAGDCPLGTDPDIVDFVGYGTGATCREGNANTPAPSNTTAIFRKLDGARDTDQNGNDFLTGAPNPRRTAPIVELGPWIAGTDPGTDDNTIPHDSSVTVNFSEPVNADPGWYNITCSISGSHNSPNTTEAHTNDFKTYAITPNVNFQFGEQCTVTVFGSSVHDQDLDDSEPGTDTLSADETWSFTVVAAGQPAPYSPSVHLTMGNPSNATPFVSDFNNYLMEKPTYSLSYNRDKGTPNWVSWHLTTEWYGSLARVDTFRPDPAVDPSWYRVQAFDYAGSGFDRGHMTPNADRDNQNRIPINQETYLMSNMVPQAPNNNQGPWADFEAYLRTQSDAGNEIYIVAGPNGIGGVGSASPNTVTTIANGHVTVPSSTWKVALFLPQAVGDDVSRVTCSSRTLAVLMPNTQAIGSDWHSYITTVDAVEQLTGYDFYSNLPPAIQACVEAGSDGTNPPGTADQTASTTEDNGVVVTLQALQANNNTLTFSIVNGPTSGSVGSVSSASCASGTCTATVTYTPGPDFNGSDNFTFRASDGSLNSNTSTVSVNISEVNDSPTTTADAVSTDEDTPLDITATNLTTNDSAGPNEASQVLTVNSVTPTADTHGTVTLNSGTIHYSPASNYNGPASFEYQVCDNGTTNGSPDAKCATGTVNVTVNAVNDPPDAADDSATIAEDSGANVISVLGNDTDVEGDALTISAVTQGAHGSVTNNGSSVSYTPSADFFGTDSFSYTVSDGHGGTDTATVNVTVTNVNDAPDLTSSVAMSLISATNSNLFNVGLTASATDKENEAVTIQVSVFGDEDDETPTLNNTVHSPDAKDIAPVTLRLRGERVEANDGRVYLIIVTATDASGGVTRNYHTVVVPKNNKQASIDSVNAQAAAAVAYASSHNGAPPPGYFVIGDGPIIGPKQ